jgi:hypothetical protein
VEAIFSFGGNMATRFRDMIQSIRDICLEYDSGPYDDDYIVRKIQFAVNYIYNHYVKSNENLFHQYYYVQIGQRKQEYDLPKQLVGKRIERLEVPSPPQYGGRPFLWAEIEKKDRRTATRFDAPRTATLTPSAWAQWDNKFFIAPPPLIGYKARLVVAMRLPSVKRDEGIITSFVGNIIRLDDAPSPNMHNALTVEGQNFLSICDGQTGRLKKVYPFEAINGLEVTLSSSDRTTIQSFPVTSVLSLSVYSVTFDPVLGTVTLNTLDPLPSDVKSGSYLELAYGLTPGQNYNIDESLTDDTDFYNPPEFVAPVSPFSRLITVISATTNSITFADPAFSPALTGGYLNPHDVTSGNVISAVLGAFSGNPVIEVEFDTTHGFADGQVYRLTINGTGVAELDGVDNKCYRFTDTKVAVLVPTLTGVFAPGTWALHQYLVTPDTGLPPLTEVSVTTPSAAIVTAYVNSPYSYQLYPDKKGIFPEEYDPINNIEIDDVVSLGYSIGANPLNELYDEVIALYAALPMRSTMNETDSVGAALLKELLTELKGDNAGRVTGQTISRDFSRRTYFTRATFRSKR